MESPSNPSAAVASIDALLAASRPKLHRYCARMTGSVIDGEDVLQDALIKAMEAFAASSPIANPEGWLFRIAHNTALDFLRRRNRQAALQSVEEVDRMADQLDAVTSRQIAATSLRTFMRLPVGRRSSVILMDVLGCSLQEVCEIMDLSLPAAKAALHRGRTQLREIAEEPEDAPVPKLSDANRARLGAYVAHFNARDFDAIRDMLADEIRLELVNRTRMKGRKEVVTYFSNYSSVSDWWLAPALIDGRPAVLVRASSDPSAPPISRACWSRCVRSCIAIARAWSAQWSTARTWCRTR